MDSTTVQMERINCVRMYLGVQYISEICNTSGDGFVVGIMSGQTRNLEYKTTTTKPYQKKNEYKKLDLMEKSIGNIIN